MYGRSHTHHRGVAGGRWKKRAQKTARIFKPNLQTVSIIEQGVRKQIRISTKALKRVKKDMADGKKPVITLVTSRGTA
jgi:ribosomal protein L28